jgi:hypothetical protein
MKNVEDYRHLLSTTYRSVSLNQMNILEDDSWYAKHLLLYLYINPFYGWV